MELGIKNLYLQLHLDNKKTKLMYSANINLGSPALGDADGILDGTLITTEQQVITSFIAQPDVARNLVLVSVVGITSNIVIVGRDIKGNAITEAVTLTENTPVSTVNAFAHIDSITIPGVEGATTETIDVGTSLKLGLPFTLTSGQFELLNTYLGGTVEGTASTITANAALSKNLITLNSALDGSEVLVNMLVM